MKCRLRPIGCCDGGLNPDQGRIGDEDLLRVRSARWLLAASWCSHRDKIGAPTGIKTVENDARPNKFRTASEGVSLMPIVQSWLTPDLSLWSHDRRLPKSPLSHTLPRWGTAPAHFDFTKKAHGLTEITQNRG